MLRTPCKLLTYPWGYAYPRLRIATFKGIWVEESFVNLVSCHDRDHEDVPEGPDEDDDPEHQRNEDRSQKVDKST
jgi:hypothetical protein